MSARLIGISVHSVKGGVGKSALATLTALRVARRFGLPTYLIDMDLTGTSLADVLPLLAPRCADTAGALDLTRAPTGFLDREETREYIELRGQAAADKPRKLPFLNDFLLFATPDWDEQTEAALPAFLWRLEGAPEHLHVIPSSALPADLDRILPVIFDEEHSAFLEARLEWLLDRLVPAAGPAVVVMDTPPTIPGLSRSVLSLALRLSREPKLELAPEEGGMPSRLRAVPIDWRAALITTLDRQDLRAAARWLDRVRPEEQAVVRVLINRAPPGDHRQRQHTLEEVLLAMGELHPLLHAPLWIDERKDLQIFRQESAPEDGDVLDALLDELLGTP